MARLGGFEPPTTWFEARYSIQLSYSRIYKKGKQGTAEKVGAAGRIRTSDRLVRSQVLYPAELQPLNFFVSDGGERGIRTLDECYPIRP